VVVTPAGDVTPSADSGLLISVGSCFRRGDADLSGKVTIGDPIWIISYLFADGEMVCLDAGDADDDGAGPDLIDAMYLLYYLFRHGPTPPEPFPGVAADPTPDSLTCDP
jgi:hypothetical protein